MEIVCRSLEEFEEKINKIVPLPKDRRSSWRYSWAETHCRPPGSRYLKIKLGSWRTEPFRLRNKTRDHLFAKPEKFAEMKWRDFLNSFEENDIIIKTKEDWPLDEKAVEVLKKIRARAKLGSLYK